MFSKENLALLGNCFLLLPICLISLALRLHHIDQESMWFDEVSSVGALRDSGTSLPSFIEAERAGDPAMVPLYFILEYFTWKFIAPESVLALRILSVFFGVLTVGVVFLIGRSMFGTFGAVVAALGVALSPRLIYYSQEIRMYSLLGLFGASSIYAFHKILRKESERGFWILLALSNVSMVWTHLHGVWQVAVQAVFLLLFRRREPHLILSWTAACIPGILSVGIWICTSRLELSTWQWIPPIAQWIMLAPKIFTIPNAALLSSVLCFLALLRHFRFVLKNCANRSNSKLHSLALSHERDNLSLLFCWLILPAVVLLVMSLAWKPTFHPRYVLPSALAIHLLVASIITIIPQFWVRSILATALLFFYTTESISFDRPFRANVSEALAYVKGNVSVDDHRLLVAPEWTVSVPNFYCKSEIAKWEGIGYDENENSQIIQNALKANQNIWLIVYDRPVVDGWAYDDYVADGAFKFQYRKGDPWPELRRAIESAGIRYSVHSISGGSPVAIYHMKAIDQSFDPTL